MPEAPYQTPTESDSEPKSDLPQVSIGIPVYNGATHLRRTIESVLAQSFDAFELIISDNASTDGTWDICQEYAERDKRIRCVRQPRNLGANPNFNILFEMSQGEFFKWTGHDDQLDHSFLERCVKALEASPDASIAYCGETYCDDEGNEVLRCDDPYSIDGLEPDVRFRQWMWDMDIKNQRRSDLVYGLIRSSHLRTTRLFRDTLATNKLLILELVVTGPVEYIEDVLVQRTPAPHRTIEQRMKRLSPTAQSGGMLPFWKLAFEFVKVAWNLDIESKRRISLVLSCVRYFLSGRRLRQLLWDIRRAARTLTASQETSIEAEAKGATDVSS